MLGLCSAKAIHCKEVQTPSVRYVWICTMVEAAEEELNHFQMPFL
jgi:hypothetical protein